MMNEFVILYQVGLRMSKVVYGLADNFPFLTKLPYNAFA